MGTIVKEISIYVALKRSGFNYVGLCPFHKEETPSFTVSPAKDSFHCFGCKVSGGVDEFYNLLEKHGMYKKGE